MKIALHHTGEVGVRAGRVMLGDARVEEIGLVGRTPVDEYGGRVARAGALERYDVLVTDDPQPRATVEKSVRAGVDVAVWVEPDLQGLPIDGVTVLTGSNLAYGIAPSLASHEIARLGSPSIAVVAWTEPGAPLRSGEALAFPEPVGGRWGRRHTRKDPTRYVAPVAGDWAGALARVTHENGENTVTRIVGVADLAPHLEALALAAGAMAVGAGAYPPGLVTPTDAAEAYLAEALRAGLDVAAHTMTAR